MSYHARIEKQVAEAYRETELLGIALDGFRVEMNNHLLSNKTDHEKLFEIYDAICRACERLELAKSVVTMAQALAAFKDKIGAH